MGISSDEVGHLNLHICTGVNRCTTRWIICPSKRNLARPGGVACQSCMEAKGHTGQLQLDERYLHVKREGLMAKATGHAPQSIDLTWIERIELKPANPGSNPDPELRKRLEQLLKELEAKEKGPKPAPPIRVIPAPGAGDRKIDPAVRKELDALLKEVTEGQKQIDDLLKKLEPRSDEPRKKVVVQLPKTIDRNAQLERRIESLLNEVDELRRELQKNKAK